MFSGVRHSIAFQLTIFYVLFFGVITTCGGVLLYHLVKIHILDEIDQDLMRLQQEIAHTLASQDPHELVTTLASSTANGGLDDYFVRVLDADGTEDIASDLRAWPRPLPSIPAAGLVLGQYTLLTMDTRNTHRPARVLTSRVTPEHYVQVGISLADSMAFLHHFKHYGLLILCSMLTLSAFSGWVLARKAIAGIQRVTAAAERIAGGHFADRVADEGLGSEIEQLARTFNRMAEHVQTVMLEMRQVNDHIAHDLRSPLTRIRGLAEHAAIQAVPHSEYADLAGSIVEECDRLSQVINTMLEIAEAEASVQHAPQMPLDLTALVTQAVELYQGVAEDRSISLTSHIATLPAVVGDRRRLQRALANLIDNALKYTPCGGAVSVSLAARQDRVEIAVCDNGPGISSTDRAHLFERFFRGDRSRHLPGNGLGLSLARAIACAHGGDIRVESSPGVGSVFTLILPYPGAEQVAPAYSSSVAPHAGQSRYEGMRGGAGREWARGDTHH